MKHINIDEVKIMLNYRKTLMPTLLCALLLLPGLAMAEGHYGHEHILHDLPRGHLDVRHDGGHYYFGNGFWYHRHGPGYIAVVPPFGLRVHVLPWGYRTVLMGGVSYYVLNDIWYQQIGPDYVVVAPPAVAPVISAPTQEVPAAVLPQQTGDDFFMYPRNGQSEQQQAKDRYECHQWARRQTGYDPTLPLGGVAGDISAQKRSDYTRAMSACLDGRGYTLR